MLSLVNRYSVRPSWSVSAEPKLGMSVATTATAFWAPTFLPSGDTANHAPCTP